MKHASLMWKALRYCVRLGAWNTSLFQIRKSGIFSTVIFSSAGTASWGGGGGGELQNTWLQVASPFEGP